MRISGIKIYGSIIAISLIALVSFKLVNYPEKVEKPSVDNPGFALVELFTSQGCSSCPPADAYLSKLIEEGEKKDEKIIALSFHVSYWNRLGWVDPFSDEKFTHRQQRYSQAYGSSTIYTPQMIVNGKQNYASSRPRVIEEGVSKMLSQQPALLLKANLISLNNDNIEFEVNTSNENFDEPVLLHAAIVEKGLFTSIKRGENVGRTLSHDNVVRMFKSWDFNKSAGNKLKLSIPKGVNIDNASLVVYAQKPSTMSVLGADQLGLNNIK